MKTCCTPARSGAAVGGGGGTPAIAIDTAGGDAPDTVNIPGGPALIGTNAPHFVVDGEGPLKRKKIAPFRMDRGAVTNARFAKFIAETGYVTEAEKFGNSLVFVGLLPHDFPPTQAPIETPWWRVVDGAVWHHPIGTQGPEAEPDHPVTHITWHDARAFANWAGGRLPSEAEWEQAARGGLGDVMFPWGDAEPNDRDHFPCNIWQGHFPQHDMALDGYRGTAPAISFEPNGYGLFNMVGNVWEYTAETFKVKSLKKSVIAANAGKKGFKLSKGGSFLCHKSYCFRYRIAARNAVAADTSLSHSGFRLAYDVKAS